MWIWMVALGAPCIDAVREGLGGDRAWTERPWTARGEVEHLGSKGTFVAAFDGSNHRIDLDVDGVVSSELFTPTGVTSWNDHGRWNQRGGWTRDYSVWLPVLPDVATCASGGFASGDRNYTIQDGRIQRMTGPAKCSDPVEVTYGDWQAVNGGWVPHRRQLLVGGHVFSDFRLKEWTEGAGDVEFRAPPRPLHAVSNAPAALEEVNHHLVVPVALTGPKGTLKGRFLFDTGYSTTTLSPESARRLDLEVFGERRLRGVTGADTAGQAVLPAMRLGETVLENRVVLVADVISPDLDGVIGLSSLENLTVDLSYNPPQLRLSGPPEAVVGSEMDMDCARGLVDVELPGAEPGRFVIDSGAYTTLVNTPKGEAKAWAEAAGGANRNVITGVGGTGRGVSYESRLDSVSVGGHSLGATDVVFFDRQVPGTQGNLGHSTMKCFDWTFDFANDRVTMQLVGDPATCALARPSPMTWREVVFNSLCLLACALAGIGPIAFALAAARRRRRQAALLSEI